MTSSTSTPPPSKEARWQERIRRRELQRHANFLRYLSDKITLNEDYTTDTPRKLARVIGEIAAIIAEKIPTIPANELYGINDFLSRIATHLRYVDRARVKQTPWSIISPAEDFLRKQAGPHSNFIIRPTWTYNYSIIGEFWDTYKVYLSCWSWFPLEELIKKLNSFFKDEESIYCISFPRIERNNCLLHANWGHEIGHIIASRWIDTQFAAIWSKAEAEVKSKIEESVRKDPPPVDPLFKEIAIQSSVAKQTRMAMEAARGGVTELICDIIGVHLFGVSALAAGIEFAARFTLDVSPLVCDNYPPWRYRLRNMIEYCRIDLQPNEGIGYPKPMVEAFLKWLAEADELSKAKPDMDVINGAIVSREAYNFISSHWDVIKKDVLAMLPATSSEPYRLFERHQMIERLIERLADGIPPNEVGNLSERPVIFQDIITAAWVFKIASITKDPNWGEPEHYNTLFRLVLKACESSHVHSVWGPKLKEDEK